MQSLEMAFKMGSSAADAFDTSQESATTMDAYGLTGAESELVATSGDGGFTRSNRIQIHIRHARGNRRLIRKNSGLDATFPEPPPGKRYKALFAEVKKSA